MFHTAQWMRDSSTHQRIRWLQEISKESIRLKHMVDGFSVHIRPVIQWPIACGILSSIAFTFDGLTNRSESYFTRSADVSLVFGLFCALMGCGPLIFLARVTSHFKKVRQEGQLLVGGGSRIGPRVAQDHSFFEPTRGLHEMWGSKNIVFLTSNDDVDQESSRLMRWQILVQQQMTELDVGAKFGQTEINWRLIFNIVSAIGTILLFLVAQLRS
eukprot:TRINITY_DN14960_c0_g2_i1.p1 TRINITY_DN14960_c0_g2~~TRINITY_DN14960_c0_g2_i1.p1  ORF type:complete len:214 (-),score=37.52 TRINITY_DN14960_c0_g2_i1:911-1552(-)